MKRVICLLFLSFGLGCICFASNPNTPKKDIIISPKQPSHNSNTRPLSIVEPDIEASYYMGAITFVFNEDLGDCNIEVLNIATGDMWSASHSGAGATVLYTSEQSGTYLIFVDSDRGTYGGEFVL